MLTNDTKPERTQLTVRDPEFYNDSKDCVIKVKDTLFKVLSTFATIFQMSFD